MTNFATFGTIPQPPFPTANTARPTPHTTHSHIFPSTPSTMKPATSLSLVASLLALAAPATAVEYTVTTCADLAGVDDTLATGLRVRVRVRYTRFRVR